MGEEKEEGWAACLGLETLKEDEILRSKKIEDFTLDRNGNRIILKMEGNGEGTSEARSDTEKGNELQGTGCPE